MDEFFVLLSRGASPAGACAQLGLSLDEYFRRREGPEFREREQQVAALQARNLFAALYRAGIEGNVSAIAQWLRLHPIVHGGGFFDSADPLSEQTDAELLEYARACGLPIPMEFAQALGGTRDSRIADSLSPGAVAADAQQDAAVGCD